MTSVIMSDKRSGNSTSSVDPEGKQSTSRGLRCVTSGILNNAAATSLNRTGWIQNSARMECYHPLPPPLPPDLHQRGTRTPSRDGVVREHCGTYSAASSSVSHYQGCHINTCWTNRCGSLATTPDQPYNRDSLSNGYHNNHNSRRRNKIVCSCVISPVLLLVVVILTSANIVLASSLGFGQSSGCDYQHCWQLFQDANNALQLPDSYGTDTSHHQSSQRVLQDRCISLRTFRVCIENLTEHSSSSCMGDLSFHSARNGIERQLQDYNCNLTGPVFNPKDYPSPDAQPRVLPCTYARDHTYQTCALFGDPHLITWDGEHQTCRVKGAWPLIDNRYLTVQVTNELVSADSDATATTRMTVMIKSCECADPRQFVTYQAQAHSLPSTFDDGRTHFGANRSVALHELEPDRHVEIRMRHVDVTIVIRRIGGYLTFFARMPQLIVNDTIASSLGGRGDASDGVGDDDTAAVLQLCSSGCPTNERIDYRRFLGAAKRDVPHAHDQNDATETRSGSSDHANMQDTLARVRLARHVAVQRCQAVGVVDFYFDSCVFDLLTTSNMNFTIAAFNAQQDLLRLASATVRLGNRTDLNETDRLYQRSSASRLCATPTSLTYMISILVTSIFTLRYLAVVSLRGVT